MRQHPEVSASLVPSGLADAAPRLQRRPTVLLGVIETPPAGLRARQLLEDAREAALEHLRALELAIAAVRDLSDEVVRGSELYGPGLRELARNLSEDLFWKAKTLALLSQRQNDRPRASA